MKAVNKAIYERLMKKAKEDKEILTMMAIHNHLFSCYGYNDDAWKYCFNEYRVFSDQYVKDKMDEIYMEKNMMPEQKLKGA